MESNTKVENETSNSLCCGVEKMDINQDKNNDVVSKSEKTGLSIDSGLCGEDSDQKHETGITREDVTLPECFKGKLAFVLRNVFTEKVSFYFLLFIIYMSTFVLAKDTSANRFYGITGPVKNYKSDI